MEPTEAAAGKRERKADLRLLVRFWSYLGSDRAWVLAGLCAVPLMSLAGLAQPWLIKEAIDGPIARSLDHIAAPPHAWSLGTVSLVFLGAVLVEFLARMVQNFAFQKAGYASLQRLRRSVFSHVLHQSAAFFDKRASGNLLSRTTADVEALGEVLTFGIVGFVGDVFDILAILAVMLWLDPGLTLVAALVTPVVVLVVQVFRRRLRFHSGEIRKSLAASSGFFQEVLAGARVVQLHGREQATVAEYRALNFRYLDAYRRSNIYDASLYAIMDGMASLCIALIVWYGGAKSLQSAVSLGLLVAFIQYVQRIFVPIRELSGKVATIERAFAALERIFGLLDVDESLAPGTHVPARVVGHISLKSLDFGYAGRQGVLQGVSLEVQPGEVVALVGPTGSGKTTLARLIARMYAAPNATLCIDGVPIEQWDLQALRSVIGTVPQDVVLFSGSLHENVTLGRPGISRDRVTQALQRARLDPVVERLGGLDVQLSEAGQNLSAGERQLLAIARILALDPPIVVLDEATANIDSRTEHAVQEALSEVFAGRTAVVVAHRLSTIRRADRIAVLDRGRIVEIGTHEELMRNGGLYAQLVEAAAREAASAPLPEPRLHAVGA